MSPAFEISSAFCEKEAFKRQIMWMRVEAGLTKEPMHELPTEALAQLRIACFEEFSLSLWK